MKKFNLKSVTYILILFIVTIIFLTGYSMAKNITTVMLNVGAQIAKPILEVRTESDPINIIDSNTQGEYKFYVRNYDQNGKISDVKMNYIIEIKDTINKELKDTIQYELYKNGKKVELNEQTTNEMQLNNNSLQEDTYILKINYNKDANYVMQDILSNIQIKVHSQQLKTV